MQIKFLAAAISSAILATAAQADVTVGGFLQAEVAYNQNQTNQNGKTDFFSGLYDVGSDIRVIGTHQVTETGKIQWEVSTYLTKEEIAPAGLAFLGDRKLYVRYADSKLGALTLGRDDSPIRMAFVQYDIFNGWASLGTVFDRSSSSRPSYQIKYVSPKMSGLTVRGSVVVASEDGTSEPDKAFYTSVAYDLNPMFGFDFGYSNEKDRGQVEGKDRKAVLAGVRGELLPGLTYGVAYVNASTWAGTGASESKNWILGENLQYVKGDHTFRAAHSYADKSAANLFLLGYEYALPEVTMGTKKISSALYVEGSYIDNSAHSDIVPGFKSSAAMGANTSTVAAGVYVSF
ncbi:porin [Chitinibacter bivalviorum]|uniref:Porin n=1 Tax=Chitinibacter bivalviorum TaxID=2739434 RepID=A0A7H9BL94_9NEIS|nr:porin [Chitinibacter bivalviorum]QLG89279.1 porin [Chitinibacter bivalviorum]